MELAIARHIFSSMLKTLLGTGTSSPLDLAIGDA
jgi:hypothetical protein